MDAFFSWLKQPFSPSMSAGRWFLFYALIMIIAALWHFTIRALANV
ncbi:MAG: hypothetical protein P4M15_08635 [Alphaproteobacteria bacterium]|nr:hypothetical protein [Alphaproteobacteria bacterium]